MRLPDKCKFYRERGQREGGGGGVELVTTTTHIAFVNSFNFRNAIPQPSLPLPLLSVLSLLILLLNFVLG